MRRSARFLRAFGLSLVLSGAGCVLLEHLGLASSGPVFSHGNHGEKEDLECANCHATYAKADAAGMPRRKVCILCHEGVDEEKPEEKKIARLFGEDTVWSRVTAVPKEVIFSHKVHHDAKVACGECHRGIETSARVSASLRVDMDGCVECHARQPRFRDKQPEQAAATISYTPMRASRRRLIANDCAVCHREVRRDVPPESHGLQWKRLHGQEVRHGGDKAERRCGLCHTEAACSSCHREEEPANHTAFWKDRGHGLAVGIDRSSCAVCHASDACDRCHRETPPRSHVGSWGGPRHNHCYSCHQGAGRQQQSCGLCHPTVVHNAPPRPADPQHAGVPESQCRNCHSLIQMQHADNGDACVSCH